MAKNASARLTGTVGLFAKLSQIPIELRGPIMRKGMQAAGDIIARRAKELVPQPGSPGYTKRYGQRSTRKHLKDTIGVKVKEYAASSFTGLVTVVGPEYPAGASGHLIERGHRIKVSPAPKGASWSRPTAGQDRGMSKAFPFVNPALSDTESQLGSAIETAAAQAINKAIAKSG